MVQTDCNFKYDVDSGKKLEKLYRQYLEEKEQRQQIEYNNTAAEKPKQELKDIAAAYPPVSGGDHGDGGPVWQGHSR